MTLPAMNIDQMLTTRIPPSHVDEMERQITAHTENHVDTLARLYTIVQKSLNKGKHTPAGHRGLGERLYQPIMQKTSHGGSGFTFLFNMTPSALPATFMPAVRLASPLAAEEIESSPEYSFVQQNMKLIFKWAPREDQNIQAIYNHIYRRHGFLAPHPCFSSANASTIQKICTIASENKLSIPSSMSLTTMIGFRGANLKEAKDGLACASWNDEDWQRLFSFLGAITALDILLGNHDRVIRFHPSQHTYMPHWNMGNIMVDIEKKLFFAIDNGIDTDLLPKEREDISYLSQEFSPMEATESSDPVHGQANDDERLSSITRYFQAFLDIIRSEEQLHALATSVVHSFFKDSSQPYKDQDSLIQTWKLSVLDMLSTLQKDKEMCRNDILIAFHAISRDNIHFREALLRAIMNNITLI